MKGGFHLFLIFNSNRSVDMLYLLGHTKLPWFFCSAVYMGRAEHWATYEVDNSLSVYNL